MDAYELMYELNEVSDYFIMETQKGSSFIRERLIVKWSTVAACVCLVIVSSLLAVYMRGGFSVVTPADSDRDTAGYDSAETTDDDISDETEPEETETSEPEPEYRTVTADNVIYNVYPDHAVAVGATLYDEVNVRDEIYLSDIVDGVPVTEIYPGAFDGMNPLRIFCDATYGIYETARAYAVEHEHIFIEKNSDKLPDHYYPDWVNRLNWRLRDTSEDDFIFVDDNARITELAEAYRSGDGSGYDELLQRMWYRYACAQKIWLWGDYWPERYIIEYNEAIDNTGFILEYATTDYDRYWYYMDDGNRQFYFTYGDIDTYDEYCDYFRSNFTESAAAVWLDEDFAYEHEGRVFLNFTGSGFVTNGLDPVFSVSVEGDRIILHEKRGVWEWESAYPPYNYHFTGDYIEYEVVFELHDGRWQYACNIFDGYRDVINYYMEYYGAPPSM